MPRKTKAKKFRRRSRTHGRGAKAGRGKGLRGGSGNAGLKKHRRVTTVLHDRKAKAPYFGKHGFTRHGPGAGDEDVVVNVRDLPTLFGETKSIDLASEGYTKLLGGGSLDKAYEVKVARASDSAVRKVEEAGGSIVFTESDDVDEPEAAEASEGDA